MLKVILIMFSTSKHAFETIYKLGIYSFLTPNWNFDVNEKIITSRVWKLIFSTLTVSPLLIFGYQTIFSIFEFNSEFDEIDESVLILNQIVLFLLCSTILASRYSRRWEILLVLINTKSLLPKSNSNSLEFETEKSFKKKMVWQFLLGNLLFILTIIINGGIYHIEIILQFNEIFTWIWILSYIYMMFIMTLYTSLIFNILVTIENKFHQIMHRLQIDLNNYVYRDEINSIQIQYRNVLEICDNFNQLFGKRILFLVSYTCTLLLVTFDDGVTFLKYDADFLYLLSILVGIFNMVNI